MSLIALNFISNNLYQPSLISLSLHDAKTIVIPSYLPTLPVRVPSNRASLYEFPHINFHVNLSLLPLVLMPLCFLQSSRLFHIHYGNILFSSPSCPCSYPLSHTISHCTKHFTFFTTLKPFQHFFLTTTTCYDLNKKILSTTGDDHSSNTTAIKIITTPCQLVCIYFFPLFFFEHSYKIQ